MSPMAKLIFQGKHQITAASPYFVCPEAVDVAVAFPYDLGASAGLLEMKAHKATAEQTAP